MTLVIPERLTETCSLSPERLSWLASLPSMVRDVAHRWSIEIGPPFDGDEVSCAWVAPATRSDGSTAVLKIDMPHFEGEHEADGLRVWNGDSTVRLLEAAPDGRAMLLERCEPGTHLRRLPEDAQDRVIAGILRRLWRQPGTLHPFRPLSAMIERWVHETDKHAAEWHDSGLIQDGLRVLEELGRPSANDMLLATDAHAGNVLRSTREPWLLIDPKPFVGDPAYDATQHLLNCLTRMQSDPMGLIERYADLLGVDAERVRLWTFARAAAEPRDNWRDSTLIALARRVAP